MVVCRRRPCTKHQALSTRHERRRSMDIGPRISAIEAQERRGNRRSIFVDGRFALGVDESVVSDLGLRVGQQIGEDELQRIVRAEQVTKAKESALRLLDFRPRSRAEISRRLARAGFGEDVVVETLERLEALGLIDDGQFARSWVAHRLAGKGMGTARIKWELRRKGVPNEAVDEALSTIDDETERRSALEAARRRWVKDSSADDRTKRRKLAAFLRRQGYDWSVISVVLNELGMEVEPE